MFLNQENNSAIIIDDDSSLDCNKQTEYNLITISDSDSDSECLSLPDIDDEDDIYATYPPLQKNNVPQSSPTEVRFNNAKRKGHSPILSTSFNFFTNDSCNENVIAISDDSLDSDLNELTSGDEEFQILNRCNEISNEEECERLQTIQTLSENDISKNKDILPDARNDFIEITSPHRKNTDISHLFNFDSRPSVTNGSLPWPVFIRPYSLQPFAIDCDLGIEGLREQPAVSINLLECYLDEGDQFALSTADIFCEYLYCYRPEQSLLENLLLWLQRKEISLSLESVDLLKVAYFKFYVLLKDIFHFYPENITILWEEISKHIQNALPLKDGVFLNFALMLEICLSVFERELFQHSDRKKCRFYHLLGSNKSYSATQKIILFLERLVLILIEKNLPILEQVLCQLMKVLEIGLVLNENDTNLAKRIAKDLVSIYFKIPYKNIRQWFLSSIQSALIRFKLLEIIMEKNYDGTILSWYYMPKSIANIAESFFAAKPMKNILSSNGQTRTLKDSNGHLSVSQCEELLMILYSIVMSYLEYLQGFSWSPFSTSSDVEENSSFPECDLESIPPPWIDQMMHLKDYSLYIAQLDQHLNNFQIELSKESHFYLKMLNLISDLTEQLPSLSVF